MLGMGPDGTWTVLVIFAIAAVRIVYHISEAVKHRKQGKTEEEQ